MKKKKLEQDIRQEFASLVPEQPPKVDLGAYFAEPKPRGPRRYPQIWTYLTGVMAVLVFVLFIFVLDFFPGEVTTTTTTNITTSPATTDTTSTSSSLAVITTTPDGNPITDLNANEYAGGIITAAKLFLILDGGDAFSLTLDDPVEPLLADDYLDLMSKYLNVMETAVVSTLAYDAIVETSDRGEYQFKLTSSALNLIGESESYLLYYNVENLTETEFDLTGIMVWGGSESAFSGHLELEEGEKKLEITTFSESDPDNYLEAQMEIETDEKQYELRAYANGDLVLESIVKIEIETDESKVEVYILKDAAEIEFTIKREIEDEETITVIEYDITLESAAESGAIVVTVTYDEVNAKYIYVFDLQSGDINRSYEKDRYRGEDDDSETEGLTFKI